MQVIDVDPDLLRRSADAALHAASQAWTHVDAETRDDIPALLETLTERGPYGYTIMSTVRPDGTVDLPIASTRDDIRDAYETIHENYTVVDFTSFLEIRGEWYTFHEGVARTRVKATDEIGPGETIALFPVTTGNGITGELVWSRVPPSTLGLGAPGPSGTRSSEDWRLRRDLIRQHERYLAALRSADVEGVLQVMNDDVQAAIRDYVGDGGTLVGLSGRKAHRSFYSSLFDKYQIRSVDLLQRAAQDWYLFAEVRITVSPRVGAHAGEEMAFHTAEFFVPAHDGRFIVRVGHGTDLGSH
jgi:hypothetical protein